MSHASMACGRRASTAIAASELRVCVGGGACAYGVATTAWGGTRIEA